MRTPVYLDCNASTPCDPRVVARMLPLLSERFANPTSVGHRPGREAARELESARATVARAIGVSSPSEVVFTSGATEANHLALVGLAAPLAEARRRIVTQVTEHASVLASLERLERSGWEVVRAGVDRRGVVRLDQLEDALTGETALLSLMLANNETGTVQPVAEAARLARAAGALVHCDAAQGPGKLSVNVSELGVDALSISAHKAYGPKGVGALWVGGLGRQVRLEAQLPGGGQERGLRSGTPNLAGTVGLAAALELAEAARPEEGRRLAALRDRLEHALLGALDEVAVNGPGVVRLPNTSSLTFGGLEGAALLAALDDLAVSTGSACTAGRAGPSPVLRAMGLTPALAAATLRVSVGRFTTEEEVDFAAGRIVEEVTRLRALRRRR